MQVTRYLFMVSFGYHLSAACLVGADVRYACRPEGLLERTKYVTGLLVA